MQSMDDPNSSEFFAMIAARCELDELLGRYYRVKYEPFIPLVPPDLQLLEIRDSSHTLWINLVNPEIINSDLVNRIQDWLSLKQTNFRVILQAGGDPCESLVLDDREEVHIPDHFDTLSSFLSHLAQCLKRDLEKLEMNRSKYSPTFNYGKHRPKIP